MATETYRGIELREQGCHVCEQHGIGVTMVLETRALRDAYRAFTGSVLTGTEAHQCCTIEDLKPAIDEMLGKTPARTAGAGEE